MRNAPKIFSLWQSGGPFIGADRPCTRVTVEPGYWLHTEYNVATPTPAKLPFRWFQRAANNQVEVEVPNVLSVSDDRNVDQDAGSCEITILNQKMDSNLTGTNNVLGDPGHYSPDRGGYDAEARWGPIDRTWEGVLSEGALIRTYQGFGGHDKSIGQAIQDGDIILDGTWLVDEVSVNSAGDLVLNCRDMASLLIEQPIFPPLLPSSQYPMSRCRFEWDTYYSPAVLEYDKDTPTHQGPEGFDKWITDLAINSKGNGYWLVGTDGGLFTFGYAAFYGGRGDISEIDNAPMVGITNHPADRGYWLVAEDGGVFGFGSVGYYGSAVGSVGNPVIRIRSTPSGNGYWILENNGGVHAFGDAGFYGSLPALAPGHTIVDMRPTLSGQGYWLMTQYGEFYAYGDAAVMTNVTPAGLPLEFATGFAVTPSGAGAVVTTNIGNILPTGDGQVFPGAGTWPASQAALDDQITSIEMMPSGGGYIISGSDGGVFSFGDAPFWGSLPAAFSTTVRRDGNYLDLSDIVKDLLLWSGFLLQGTGRDDVYGNIEATGTYAEACFKPDFFDKKFVIDPITAIKELVGFIFYVDGEGAVHFEPPNWWEPGNLLEDGSRVQFIPEVDERHQLFEHSARQSMQYDRSEIIVGSQQSQGTPDPATTTRYVPPNPNGLRGQVRPAMWLNGHFTSAEEQATTASLIGMHYYFKKRQSSATCIANPAININDQVWVFDRTTGEAAVKYVRGVSKRHDLTTGDYTMTLTLNQLGYWPNWWVR